MPLMVSTMVFISCQVDFGFPRDVDGSVFFRLLFPPKDLPGAMSAAEVAMGVRRDTRDSEIVGPPVYSALLSRFFLGGGFP